jgi:hypothetical protein
VRSGVNGAYGVAVSSDGSTAFVASEDAFTRCALDAAAPDASAVLTNCKQDLGAGIGASFIAIKAARAVFEDADVQGGLKFCAVVAVVAASTGPPLTLDCAAPTSAKLGHGNLTSVHGVAVTLVYP